MLISSCFMAVVMHDGPLRYAKSASRSLEVSDTRFIAVNVVTPFLIEQVATSKENDKTSVQYFALHYGCEFAQLLTN